MNRLKPGNFFGQNHHLVSHNHITVTETEFEYQVIDWHSHENPYFSFTLVGTCRESTRRVTFDCTPNSALFHNAQESHSNLKSGEVARGFQVEMDPRWCEKYDVRLTELPSSAMISHPSVKLHLYNIYLESRRSEATSPLTIEALLMDSLELMRGTESKRPFSPPIWVNKIDEILHDDLDRTYTLFDLAGELGVHWAHLSREFPRYFRCNFSQYVRKLKVERSLGLLRDRSLPLADIAFRCGFSDQSHFNRCFKQYTRLTPQAFRRNL